VTGARSNAATAASLVLAAAVAAPLAAAPVVYEVDASHTFPSFAADHQGGLSLWRGKFNRSSGQIILDREANAGIVEITVDVSSIDFGHDKLNEEALGPKMFDATRFPTATYKGALEGFRDGQPTKVVGTLTMRGIAQPLTLTIDTFLCKPHFMLKREVCGANARGEFDRAAFGLAYGKAFGFDMAVTLEIQVEAIRRAE
jgi:polyisoprenoid-binding protein YceI